MKKFTAIILSLTIVFLLFGCTKEEPPVTPSTTLMIYMVGSDLEAKSGNATQDLEEMAKSGVDVANANVIVYTGGSKKWHNDFVSQEEHSVLKLGKDGFEQVSTMPSSSMGEAETLTAFLNYVCETYPSDNYALILWNHGNGPVIGYGKDIEYDNDSLTLKEMQTALEASPFSSENKLKWVGFDACLMASAELACIFDNYAEYLVASQEIEPHFGWDYSFLSKLTTTESPEILKSITQSYYNTCEEYYEEKGYSGRDTTISVMDLSKAAAVEKAINALFAKAEPDVNINYNSLAAKRVDTRALGRASTGSEYDLIDINDMADKLAETYPQEAEALKKAIGDMVVVNQTNAEGLCGVSIYYPFYNKKRYESEWSDAYKELNLFADYRAYLQAYCEIWLGTDFLDNNATSTMPTTSAQGVYNLELTPEQSETYAQSKFVIFERAGEDLYRPIYISSNIDKSGNTLTTNFDGNIIYFKNKFEEHFIPVIDEHDTVGDISRYSVLAEVCTPDVLRLSMEYQDIESKQEYMRFHIAVNNKTKEVALSALVPSDEDVDTETLTGGKLPEPDLSEYAKYIFPHQGHYYITRYDNGAIRPFKDWTKSSVFMWNEEPIGDGVEFVFAPLVTGEYYFIYQIEDTQGNQYCSDIMPIKATGSIPDPPRPDPVSVDWTSGDSVKLGTYAGVDVSMKLVDDGKGGKRYSVVCHNNNSYTVDFTGYDVIVNGNVHCPETYIYYYKSEFNSNNELVSDYFIEPGETIVIDGEGMNFGAAEDAEKLKDIRSLSFTFDIIVAENLTTLVNEQRININIKENHNTALDGSGVFATNYDFPSRGLFATEQTLYNDGQIKLTLTGLGAGSSKEDEWGFVDKAEDFVDGEINAIVGFENLGTKSQWVQVVALVFDGIAVPATTSNLNTQPGCTTYDNIYISADTLDMYGITSAKKIEIIFRKTAVESISGSGGFSQFYRATIKLAQSGSPAKFQDGSKVLMNENGVKVTLVSSNSDKYGTEWILAVTNSGTGNYCINVSDMVYNGQQYSNSYQGLGIIDNYVLAGEKTYVELNWYTPLEETQNLASKIVFMDVAQEKILYVSNTQIDWVTDGQLLQP